MRWPTESGADGLHSLPSSLAAAADRARAFGRVHRSPHRWLLGPAPALFYRLDNASLHANRLRPGTCACDRPTVLHARLLLNAVARLAPGTRRSPPSPLPPPTSPPTAPLALPASSPSPTFLKSSRRATSLLRLQSLTRRRRPTRSSSSNSRRAADRQRRRTRSSGWTTRIC
jgi:hypothetical protein